MKQSREFSIADIRRKFCIIC
ncbi:hypothetical protein Bhyg_13004 [Pseudolycoriella hygida]|uniref:Uncharacterized protein n=1 Tax=Pseudolycoriella hygida TaxID=35572 RepID=A0A9Q0MZY7_9DIPT|nr:hypothetical protein Bhyg_13004 [Pseudolycoriella hygida]